MNQRLVLLLCVVTAAYQVPSGNLIRDIEIVRSLLPFNTSMLLFPLCIMTFAHNHKHLTCYNECCYGDGGLVLEVNERLENNSNRNRSEQSGFSSRFHRIIFINKVFRRVWYEEAHSLPHCLLCFIIEGFS